jgi:hypothetical protein
MSYEIKALPGGNPTGLNHRRIDNSNEIDKATAPSEKQGDICPGRQHFVSGRPSLRLVESGRRQIAKPFRARISVNRAPGSFGRSREFALSEADLRQLVDLAVRLEGGR